LTKDEALKLALEALKTLHDENMDYLTRNKLGGENNQCMVFAREAITAIKAALAQPVQEPVAWVREWIYIGDEKYYRLYDEEKDCRSDEKGYGGVCRPLVYGDTTPPAAQPAQEPVFWNREQPGYDIFWNATRPVPMAQPAQESEILTIVYQSGYHDGKQAALAKREWNFCERCGKRTNDIHTCTPPQEGK
jgi:hypothetical protein